jgi:hypothetical protein
MAYAPAFVGLSGPVLFDWFDLHDWLPPDSTQLVPNRSEVQRVNSKRCAASAESRPYDLRERTRLALVYKPLP